MYRKFVPELVFVAFLFGKWERNVFTADVKG